MKRQRRDGRRLSSLKLTLLFLAIIMIMSILFSSVFYVTSINVLDKRLTSDLQTTQIQDPNHELNEWIGHRADESKSTLAQHLVILNLLALGIGMVISYQLARIALSPIERALNQQDRFISDASHELRTPITAALLSNEVALKNTSLTIAQARKVLGDNVTDMQQLKHLSDELLDQTRTQNSLESLSEVSLDTLIRKASTYNEKLAQMKDIHIDYAIDEVKLQTYPKLVAKILTIIIDNSIKYSDSGTTITISSTSSSHHIAISIKDEGIGISKHDLPYIFDRFYRSDLSRSEHEGYGLGLSIAKDLITKAKGTITAVSSLGVGSTFTIELPKDFKH